MKKQFIVGFFLLLLCACTSSPGSRLQKLSEDVNKQCPMTIDAHTICDSTSYTRDSNVFTYYFSLVNYSETPSSVAALRMRMEQLIPESVQTNPELNHFRKFNVTLDYRYYSGTNGSFLFQVSATP